MSQTIEVAKVEYDDLVILKARVFYDEESGDARVENRRGELLTLLPGPSRIVPNVAPMKVTSDAWKVTLMQTCGCGGTQRYRRIAGSDDLVMA